MTLAKRPSVIRLQCILNSFSEAASRYLKKHQIFPEAATHLLEHKKYVRNQQHIFFQKQSHKFFTVSAQNIHTLRKDFHNLLMVMKNIFDGWLKNFVGKI